MWANSLTTALLMAPQKDRFGDRFVSPSYYGKLRKYRGMWMRKRKRLASWLLRLLC